MLLEVRGLNVHYGKLHVLKGVSLNVEEGELVAVIGANGAGKTTLLRTIVGLVRPTSGRIIFAGRDITGLEAWDRVRLGITMIPEGRGLFPYLTVLENLLVGAYLEEDREAVRKRLEEVYRLFPILRERRNQMARTLSGGEGQMLAIGRSLMGRPRLLLMDEPSMGLMPKLVDELFEVIGRLKEEGITILLVEQNARKALEVADRGYVLETGRVVLKGTAEELRENPMVRKAYLGG